MVFSPAIELDPVSDGDVSGLEEAVERYRDALDRLRLLATAHSRGQPKVESSPAAGQGGYHAFVARPFGRKQEIDFNRIYQELIRPALESAGYSVFRADE